MTAIAQQHAPHACHCPRCRLAAAERDVAHWTAIIGGYGHSQDSLMEAALSLQTALRRRERALREMERCKGVGHG